ncbi:MAG TPA: AMP-binding protein [Sporichthya sp.]|nr:AMP-binding protein [Sporichthya sp.]
MAATLTSALRWWARTRGDDAAIVLEDDTLSFRALQDWSSRVGENLAARGVQPGDRVGVLGGNSLEWAAAALGVLKAGAVVVPLNPRLVGPELHKILVTAGASMVLHEPAFEPVLKEVVAMGANVEAIGLDAVADLRDGATSDFVVDVDPDAPCMVIFTSGTTGLSKGVICTNRQLLSIAFEASLTEEGMRPGGRTLLVLPLAFTPGLVWGLSLSAILGTTLVVEKSLDPARAVELIEKYRIGALFGVPLIFGAIASAPNFADADLSSLTSAFTGGAPVPVPMLQAWAAKGVKLRQIYGMTEAGGVATATLVKDAADHPDTCGTGSVFTEFRVVLPDGTDCEPGENGEILLRGPGMTPGYWDDAETTAQAIRDGWIRSGDLGTTSADGRLRFVDRVKDLIITGGINVSPVEVEQVIAGIPGVSEVAVIRAPDERFGETPAAIVVADPSVTVEAVVERCNAELSDYKVPRYVVLRAEPLPKLPSGKLAKVAIREEYRDVVTHHPKVR